MVPCQLNGLVVEPCLASLFYSRSPTGYRAYVPVHDHSSAGGGNHVISLQQSTETISKSAPLE